MIAFDLPGVSIGAGLGFSQSLVDGGLGFSLDDGVAHSHGAHVFSVDAHALVASFPFGLSVCARRSGIFFGLAFGDFVAHSQRAHVFAVDAHANVATFAFDVIVFADGLGFDLTASLQRPNLIGEAIFERAEPFSVVADARVAVDLVSHARSAFFKDLVTATRETFPHVSGLNATLSSLQNCHRSFLRHAWKTEHESANPRSSRADASVAILFLRFPINAHLLLFGRKAL